MAKNTKNSNKVETVRMTIPYVEGEDTEETVGINGKMYKIQKGKTVDIPLPVAKVLDCSSEQTMAFQEYKESIKNQDLNKEI